MKKFRVGAQKRDPDHMWRVRYPDGQLSADYYNFSWAKEHVRRNNEYLAREKHCRGY